ncbi:hypothetical protein [Lactiplantibacillus pentosus]|uniref:Capsular polysaccharide biosynthesis protein CpsC n=1 Tax=Lactiplantibacillus pentosus DSM 20314 TaxID=1423791 RepID=A0A837RFG8_LACPE|nr:hypothetical protein [Lactiplantibacillus pentosus]AYJ41419.1 hypothetical protein LP314_05625 [Lactiplantibacillus pentosus]KRK26894.1 hypothetical protein FD24_GL000023 [Lactiplantibacillus pentosus DSM 20314]MCC3164205.1 hypothetical protein [Lactiplantibacillus pentosus]MCJ8189316.1 hypothetical protein [Lactiplantibacillus pentosus]MCT3300365.1 hypothetical protein [Lactiplantibacillus pentosus]
MNNIVGWNAKIGYRFLKKYTLIIVLVGLVLGVASALYVVKTKPVQYESTSQLVQNDNNYDLISSYQQFIKSNKFTNLLEEKIADSKWKSAKNTYSLTVSQNGSNSPFFSIAVKSTDGAFSNFVATQSVQLFVGNVSKYLSSANVSVLSVPSSYHEDDFKTRTIKTGFLGFIVGAFLAAVVSFLSMTVFGKIPDEKYINDMYNLKLLGVYTDGTTSQKESEK